MRVWKLALLPLPPTLPTQRKKENRIFSFDYNGLGGIEVQHHRPNIFKHAEAN